MRLAQSTPMHPGMAHGATPTQTVRARGEIWLTRLAGNGWEGKHVSKHVLHASKKNKNKSP